MSDNQVSVPLNFTERIEAKLKESFADFVTADELKRIVEKGIEKALWEKRINKADSYGRVDYDPPLVDSVIEKHLKAQIQAAVDLWIIEHPEKLKEAVDSSVQLGISGCVIQQMDKRFDEMLSSKLVNFQSMFDEIQRIRQKVGY